MDTLLTLLGAAGVTFIMGIPGADDVMLHYQSTSFHNALYIRGVLSRRPAPEFEQWIVTMGLLNEQGQQMPVTARHQLVRGIDT
ncbi:ethanolamine ammonia-lyase subunit EutB [Spirosoma fluminis]